VVKYNDNDNLRTDEVDSFSNQSKNEITTKLTGTWDTLQFQIEMYMEAEFFDFPIHKRHYVSFKTVTLHFQIKKNRNLRTLQYAVNS
jgi:hypothetical protein